MKFEEVINALRNGQKIKCLNWNSKEYIIKDKWALIDIFDICSDNWEIIPEKVKLKLTEKEKIILAGLQAMGYKWITHNKYDDYDFAFIEKPRKHNSPKGMRWSPNNFLDLNFIEVTNLHIAKWSDDEPLSIDWLLESE